MPKSKKFRLTSTDRRLVEATREALAAVRERITTMSAADRMALDRAISLLDALPVSSDAEPIEISFGVGSGADWHKGCDLTVSGGQIAFNVGGYESGPYGSDSFTDFNYAIWAGAPSEFDPSSDDPEIWIEHMTSIAKSPTRPKIEG